MSVYQPTIHPPSRLAPALEGKLVLPTHSGFDQARQAWNLAVQQHPAAVAYPETAFDVAATVLFAAERGQRVAPQGTGHNAAPFGSLDNTILLKTERMRGVTIDPVARTAHVRAGTLWIEVVEAAARYGLAALAGSSPDVGVVGYTLGGGMSFLARKYGLAANNVRSIELVTADGRLVRADHEHEPELFWALRGGGGNFGIVTSIELELFKFGEVYAGVLWYPIERGDEVLHAWRELTRSELPDELTTIGRYLRIPPIPEAPEPLRGKSFVLVEAIHAGEPGEADALLAPLRSLGPVNDTIATIPVTALSHLHMDPEQPVPAVGDGLMLSALPPAAVDELVGAAGAESESPLLSVELRHLGGELARARPENGALASVEAEYVLYAVGMTPTPKSVDAVTARVQLIQRALAPWTARHMYLNFADTSRDPRSFFNEFAYDRLRRVQSSVDPTHLIRANHPIAGSGAPSGRDA